MVDETCKSKAHCRSPSWWWVPQQDGGGCLSEDRGGEGQTDFRRNFRMTIGCVEGAEIYSLKSSVSACERGCHLK